MALHRAHTEDEGVAADGGRRRPGSERAVRLLIAAAAAAVSAAGAALVLAGVTSPARPYVVLVGLVLGSGWAVVGWLNLRPDAAYIGSLTLAVGVSVPIAVSILLVLSSWWHPVGVSGALLGVTAGVNLLLVVRHSLDGGPRAAGTEGAS